MHLSMFVYYIGVNLSGKLLVTLSSQKPFLRLGLKKRS